MSWFYERWTKVSEKNGQIICQRWLGRWDVRVDGYSQSGPYSIQMFKGALRRILGRVMVKRALILGLGGGGIVELLQKKFPGVQITIIEWDPCMIEIADRMKMFSPSHRPHIILGDATKVISLLNETFDFILVDLFKGPDLAPAIFLPFFQTALKKVCHAETILLINAFRSEELLSLLNQNFVERNRWRFKYNYLGIYQGFQ